MKVLGIVELTITDPSWVEEYVKNVTPLVAEAGGVYITRTQNIEALEGESDATVLVVSEFPSREAAHRFYHSEEYKPYRETRIKGSVSRFLLVDKEKETEYVRR